MDQFLLGYLPILIFIGIAGILGGALIVVPQVQPAARWELGCVRAKGRMTAHPSTRAPSTVACRLQTPKRTRKKLERATPAASIASGLSARCSSCVPPPPMLCFWVCFNRQGAWKRRKSSGRGARSRLPPALPDSHGLA